MKFASACFLAVAVLAPMTTLIADDAPSVESALTTLDHQHKPIVVRSKPVIDRLRLDLIEPVDLVVLSDQSVVIVDKPSGHIFRVLATGDVILLARNLKTPSAITRDADDTVSVLHGEIRDRQITQIAVDGLHTERASNLGRASVIAQAKEGQIYVFDQRTSAVRILRPDGTQTRFAVLPAEAIDLCVDAAGQLVALLSDGRIGVVTAAGRFVDIARQEHATRLAAHPDGRVVVVDQAATSLRIALAQKEAGQTVLPVFASVPRGTSAIAFDQHGNLVLANVAMRAVTRVTSHIRIPCPHCSQQVPLVFDPHHTEPEDKIRF